MAIKLIFIPLIGLFAFFIKGLTGTGPATVMVALGSFLLPAKEAVVLASFVNMIGGFTMLPVDPIPVPKRYWISIAIFMVIGSVIGAVALGIIDPRPFEILLGIVFVGISIWFIFGEKGKGSIFQNFPQSASLRDIFAGFIGGFCGGFIGSNAPPLLYHFGRILPKREARRLLVLIFIPAAIAQTVTFASNGLLTIEVVGWGGLLIPCIGLGIYLGNKAFSGIPVVLLHRAIGILVLIAALRLII